MGTIPNFSFAPGTLEIAEKLGILDMERGAKVAGSHFYFLGRTRDSPNGVDELGIFRNSETWFFSYYSTVSHSKRSYFWNRIPSKDENYVVNPGVDDLYLIGTG